MSLFLASESEDEVGYECLKLELEVVFREGWQLSFIVLSEVLRFEVKYTNVNLSF